MEGYIENVEGKPLITRIKVHYHLRVPRAQAETAQRVMEIHERGCPAAESVKRGIAIQWDGEISEG